MCITYALVERLADNRKRRAPRQDGRARLGPPASRWEWSNGR